MKKKIIISWFTSVLLMTAAIGQDFNFEARIPSIDTAGYYKMLLSSEVLGQLNSSQGDIRIYDQNGIEIPYFITQETGMSTTVTFKEYEIIERNFVEDEISYLIFHNPEKKKVDNISIIVQNTDIRKRARLSGSNDNETWYVIKNDYLLHSMFNNKETTELKILNFPLSNYTYFKLEINDYWKLPINILKVGYYDYQQFKGKITTFDIPVIHLRDSLKTSYYKLDFREKQYIENLKFTMTGADYYRRHTTIFEKIKTTNKKKEVSYHYSSIGSFELNSNSDNTLSLHRLTTDELYFEIDNLDNQPLTVEKVTGSFLNKYLIAELNPNHAYVIRYNDINTQKPRYDLVAFKDQIPDNLAVINHERPVLIKEAKSTKKKGKSIFDNKYVIWFVIGIVGALLAFISFKMVKEIGEKKEG